MTVNPDQTTYPIAIVGPTASGKTALANEVALVLKGEVISMDSRQVYRGMDIGTAKATPGERAAVPSHGLDLVSPGERFSAVRFARYAREVIDQIQKRGATPILVGGTGFFLRALTHPTFAEPELDPDRRRQLGEYLNRFPTETLLGWLRAFDPVNAERLTRWGGRQRILRALEMPLLTSRSLSWWHANSEPEAEPLSPLVFVLNPPRELLDERITRRVQEMVAAGLVEEVARLMAEGYDEHSPGMNATGYRELIPYLRGEIPLEEALEEIRRNTRAYSKRQLTWFRGQLSEGAVWLDGAAPREDLVSEIVETTRLRGVSRSGAP
ncbi:MAG: tRNA (adenosine(37)-N6)-dimethylallyltransferase MiaA [Gemmatimonadota bacterium]|jgi:tRNA dimethylallyltransferase|nr:tRNA (adenosine(37)-N6)-dimethylallyltransferase MiaA [Gemmatimonadota bacterium]